MSEEPPLLRSWGGFYPDGFVRLGAVSGLISLVWVAYLAGTIRQPPPQQVVVREAELDGPPLDAEPLGYGELPRERSIPEVWTRMAGLNVWIAGEREPEGERNPRIVIMLHGFAKPRDSLLIMAEKESAKFGTVFIFPEAPVSVDWRRRAWWTPRYTNYGSTPPPPEAGLRPAAKVKFIVPDREVVAARQKVLNLIQEVVDRFEVSRHEILLAGFSQGASLALDVALHSPEPLGALAFLSGKALYLEDPVEAFAALRETHVLISHGRTDPLAQFEPVAKMQRQMKEAKVNVTFVPYDGGHQVPRAAQFQLNRFIRGFSRESAEPESFDPPSSDAVGFEYGGGADTMEPMDR